MGDPKIAPPPHFFAFVVTCPWAQNGGCKKAPPHSLPLRGQLPTVKAYLGVDHGVGVTIEVGLNPTVGDRFPLV